MCRLRTKLELKFYFYAVNLTPNKIQFGTKSITNILQVQSKLVYFNMTHNYE